MGMKGYWAIPVIVSILILGTLGIQEASAAVQTLIDENAVVKIEDGAGGSNAGVMSYTVDGVDHMVQEAWWFSTGGAQLPQAGPEVPIASLGVDSSVATDVDSDGDNDKLVINFGPPSQSCFDFELTFELTGGAPGSGTANLKETLTSGGPCTGLFLNHFHYTDFDAASITINSSFRPTGSSVTQGPLGAPLLTTTSYTDFGGNSKIPNVALELGLASDLLGRLNDANIDTFVDTSVGTGFGLGDAAFVAQFQSSLDPLFGGPIFVVTEKQIQQGTSVFAPDHYFGYNVADRTVPKFSPLKIRLLDQFETGIYDVLKPIKMYNPATKNREPVQDTVTHLKAYKIRGPHEPVTDIILTNQFETLVVNTKRVNSILVPTAKSHDGPTDPLIDEPVDHFKCYNITVVSKIPGAVKKKVRIFDTNFDEVRKVKVVGKPLLCNPVEKFDFISAQQLSEIKNPDIHLTCYKVKPRGADLGHDRIKFDTNNQFGPEFLKTKLHDEIDRNGKLFRSQLCVPTMKQIITNG